MSEPHRSGLVPPLRAEAPDSKLNAEEDDLAA
jgi:hypothetical protein